MFSISTRVLAIAKELDMARGIKADKRYKIVYRLPKRTVKDDNAYLFLEHNREPVFRDMQPYYPEYLLLSGTDTLSLIIVIVDFELSETSMVSVAIAKKSGVKYYFDAKNRQQLSAEYRDMVTSYKGHQVSLTVGNHLEDGDTIEIQLSVMPGLENYSQLFREASFYNEGILSSLSIPIRVK